MLFLTSISPKHILENRQQQATKTWLVHGDVISFNHPEEIEIIKTQGYDERIKFIPTFRTQKPFFGKHFVTVNTMTDYVSENNIEHACLINSDISITPDKAQISSIKELMKNNFVYLHRFDFDQNEKRSDIYMLGVDAFFFSAKLTETLPQTMYCLGHTYFDIWLPYHFLINAIPLLSIRTVPIIFHQKHQAQYNEGAWITMGKYTGFLIGMEMLRPHEISTKIYNALKKNTQYL